MNPFRYGEVVTGKDFCDRPDLIGKLRQRLKSGRNTAVVGERRAGKTSLIHETARRIRGLHLVHAQMWAVKSPDDVAQRLIDAIISAERKSRTVIESVTRALSSLRPRIELDPFSGQPSVTLTPTHRVSPRGLRAVFDLIEDTSRQRNVAVLFDEFQDIRFIEESDALLGSIRDRIQHQTKIAYVFAGSVRHAMDQLFRDPKSPFFKAVSVIEVASIDRKRFTVFLKRRFQNGQRNVPDSLFDQILDLAEDNPSDVQQLCSAIWDCSSSRETISQDQLQRALNRIFATERKGYEALVRPLTDIQMRCLRGLAKLGGDQPQSKQFLEESGIQLPASVKRALDRLVNLELIYGREQNYRFFDPFFRQWILSRF